MSLIMYYPFKNGSLENIVGTQVATNTDAIYTKSLGKESFYFNGSTSFISAPFTNSVTTELSMFAWVYLNAYTSDRSCILIKTAYLTVNSIGKVSIYNAGKSPSGYHDSNTTIELNKWYHIGVTWNITEAKIYINGVLDRTIACSGNPTIGTPIGVGSESGSGRQLNGYITDARIYNNTLTITEINQLYTTSNPQTKIDLIAHYPLNGNTDDYSAYGNNATNSGATIDNNGKIGKCYSFTSGNTITTNNTNLNNLEHFTICLWHYFTDATYPRTFSPIHKNNGSTYVDGISNRGWDFGHVYSSSSVRVDINDGVNKVSSGLTFDVGNRPSDLINKWVHLTYEVNRIDKKVYAYVNGVKQSTSVDISNITGSISNNAVLKIGELYGWYLIGKLNDIRIYNGVLSPKEIKELAKAKILHYNFNDFQEPTTNLLYEPFTGFGAHNVHTTSRWDINKQVNVGDEYIISAEFKRNKIHDGRIYCQFSLVDSNNIQIPGTSGLLSGWGGTINEAVYNYFHTSIKTQSVDKWFRFSLPIIKIPPGYGGGYIKHISFNITTGGGNIDDTTEFRNAILEQNDHATQFTIGVRTGQVHDSSGYDNHADILATKTPQWTELSKIGTGCYYWGTDKIRSIIKSINVPTDTITMNCWFKVKTPTTVGFTSYHIPMAINSANFEMSISSSGALRVGFYLSGTRYVNDHGSGLLDGNWHMLTIIYDGTSKKGYIDGVLVGNIATSGTLTSGTQTLRIGEYSTDDYGNKDAYQDDVRIYATALSLNDIKKLYQVGQFTHNNGSLETNQFIENGYGHTLVNYNKWVVGDFVYQDGWNNHGGGKPTQYSDLIALYSNPQGEQDIVYESKVLDNTFVNYRTRGLAATPTILPDITKTYRLSCWVYISGNTTSGTSWYAGLDYSKVCNINTTTPNSNPYQHVLSGGVSTGDKWILCVSYIYPYGSIGNVNNAKRYLPDGTIHSTGTDYNWNSGISSFFLRWLFNYQYDQPNVNQYTLLYRPRFDLIDGTEPTLQELLKCQDHKPLPLTKPEFNANHSIDINEIREAFVPGITFVKDDNNNTQKLICDYFNGETFAKANSGSFVMNGVTFNTTYQKINPSDYNSKVIMNMSKDILYINKIIEN